MKIKTDDYEELRSAIARFAFEYGKENLRNYFEKLKQDEEVNNPVVRLMWDLFRTVRLRKDEIELMVDKMRRYGCHDKHITTALLKIYKERIIKILEN